MTDICVVPAEATLASDGLRHSVSVGISPSSRYQRTDVVFAHGTVPTFLLLYTSPPLPSLKPHPSS